MKNFTICFICILFLSPLAWGQKGIKNGIKVLEGISNTSSKAVPKTLQGISLATPAGYQAFCLKVGTLRNRLVSLGNSAVRIQEGTSSPQPTLLDKHSVRSLGILQAEKLLEETRNSMILSPEEKNLQTATLEKHLIDAERKIKQVTLSYFRIREEYASLFDEATNQLPLIAEKGAEVYAVRQQANPMLSMIYANLYASLPIENELEMVPFEFYNENGDVISAVEMRPLDQFVIAGISTDLPWVTTFENLTLQDFAVYAFLRQRLEETYTQFAKAEEDGLMLQNAAFQLSMGKEQPLMEGVVYEELLKEAENAWNLAIETQKNLLEFVDFVSQHPVAFKPLIDTWVDIAACDTPLAKNIRRMLKAQ